MVIAVQGVLVLDSIYGGWKLVCRAPPNLYAVEFSRNLYLLSRTPKCSCSHSYCGWLMCNIVSCAKAVSVAACVHSSSLSRLLPTLHLLNALFGPPRANKDRHGDIERFPIIAAILPFFTGRSAQATTRFVTVSKLNRRKKVPAVCGWWNC